MVLVLPKAIRKVFEHGVRGLVLYTGFSILMIGVGLPLTGAVEANSSIGIKDGNPLIEFGRVDPARPPVVVAGGTQLLIVAPRDTWTLAVEARGDLINTDQPETQIPVSRLAWAIGDGNPPRWTPLEAATPQIVHGPADPTEETGTTIRIDYRFSPSWEDPPLPGPFTTQLCFTLSPNLDPRQSWVYPTPFYPDGQAVLTIGYWLPGSGPEQVEVVITDIQGEVVRTISVGQMAGTWVTALWDGKNSQGEVVAPGIYHYQVVLPSHQPVAAGIIEIADRQYAGRSAIHGRVARADTGEGLTGAQVALYTGARRQVAAATTSKHGAYQLDYLPAGEYYLEASLPGYVATGSDIFYLDGYETRDIQLQLLPNRALDIALQLSSKTVAVGDILQATLRITNSGTRDLLGAIGEIQLPKGFTYLGGRGERGRVYGRQEGEHPGDQVCWEIGPLSEGESIQAEIWLLVGLDAFANGNPVKAQATGYASSETVVTPVISHVVEVTAGPFTPTSPRSLIDSHLLLPLGSDRSLEVRIEPDPTLVGPNLPFQATQVEKHLERNPLVPVAEPLLLTFGESLSHRLRLRLEGREWALEGGNWSCPLPHSPVVSEEIRIAGVYGATRFGNLILRGFFGAPLTWPAFRLYPANNTSGPFALPHLVLLPGTVDVTVLSWDPLRRVWQEEAPVLFRVDYTRGMVTLGRAVRSHNSRGEKQYILVSYAEGPTSKDTTWQEMGLAIDRSIWGIVASYLQAGIGGQLRLASLRGRISNERLRVQGSIQANLKAKSGSWSDLAGVLPEDHSETSSGIALADRSAWQLVAVLEAKPGLRLGGGWGRRGPRYSGFWGITASDADKPPSQADQGLDRLVLYLGEQLALGSGGRQGVGPLGVGQESRTQAFGVELDLVGGWTTSLVVRQEKLSVGAGMAALSRSGDISEGWEQRLDYQGAGLPRWSLGYGRQTTQDSFRKDRSHYGLLEVQGSLQNLKWEAELSLIQDLPGDTTIKVEEPIQIVAEVGAEYGQGRFRPHLHGRQGVSLVGEGYLSRGSFQEWAVGMDSKVTENLEVGFVHTNKQASEGGNNESGFKDSGYSDTTASSEAIALVARYALWEKWTLKGSGEWITPRQRNAGKPHWQGGLDLEGKLDGGISLELGWARTQSSGTAEARLWVDQLSLGVRQRLSGGLYRGKRLHLSTSIVEGRAAGWEVAGETLFEAGDLWEIWVHGAVKMARSEFTGNLLTRQGIVRLARRLHPNLAGFVQIGGWQQAHKAELGSSLGLTYRLGRGLEIAMGYTWPLHEEGQVGLLSVSPGLFLQLFAH